VQQNCALLERSGLWSDLMNVIDPDASLFTNVFAILQHLN